MTVYSYSQARQRLSAVLDKAERDGSVRIRRQDGQEFELVPVERATSPFDIESLGLDLSADEIIAAIRESRERDDRTT
ncbi:MAG: type II toxin-antitoxin system Phd/YefM family antitoxin [Bacteroidota bacterium]